MDSCMERMKVLTSHSRLPLITIDTGFLGVRQEWHIRWVDSTTPLDNAVPGESCTMTPLISPGRIWRPTRFDAQAVRLPL